MIVCRVKPKDANVCFDCLDGQIDLGFCAECDICPKVEECELLNFYYDIFGRGWAIVITGVNRRLKRVPILRIFDVKEKEKVV